MKSPQEMFKCCRLIWIFPILFFISGHMLRAQDLPPRPVPPRLVNDFAGVLKPDQSSALESKLVAFARSSSTQIVVAILPDLGGYDASDYAFRLGESWGVGQKETDNGFVVLVQPKTPELRGQAFIATGYGVEEYAPDAVVNRIVDSEMIPRFRQNDYYGGIDGAVDILISLTEGKFTGKEYMESTESPGAGWVFLVFFIVLMVVISAARKRRHHSIGKGLPFWLALFMMEGGRNVHSGHFGNFRSGGGSFGGFGGGGFGGFGGGSFGGGGAGGSW